MVIFDYFLDISRHKRKNWYTYSLSDSNNEPDHIGIVDFTQSVKEKLDRQQLLATKIEVNAIIFNGIMYLSIELIKKNNVKVQSNYFALFLDQNYLFSAKQKPSNIFIEAITHSMGYNKHKSIDLKGKNLMSLLRLLRLRIQGALSVEDIINKKTYQDAQPMIR